MRLRPPPWDPQEGAQLRVRVPPAQAIVTVAGPAQVAVTMEPPEDPVMAERWGSDSVMLVRLIFAACLEESSWGECARNHDFVSMKAGGAAVGRPSGTA